MKNSYRIFLFLYILIAASFSQAEISWPKDNLQLSEAITKIIQSVQESVPNEHAEIYSSYDIHIKDNRAIQRIIRIYYFPNNKSIQNNGAEYLTFNEKLDQVKINYLGSLTKDKKFISVSKSDLKINDSNTYNTFSSHKYGVFNFPGLDVGSFGILDYTITRDISKQETDWSRELFVEYIYPRMNFNLSLSWPADHPIFWKTNNKYLTCTEESNTLTCSGKNIPAIKTEDKIYWADQFESIQIGSYTSWDQAISHSLDKFFLAIDSHEDEIGKFVDGLVGEEENIEKKIDIIYKFVSQEIQYVSHSEHGNAITPHSVIRTLNKRFGDCKDKAALFYSMLNDINVKAVPVLVATDRTKPARLAIPSLNYFDHMIVCFQVDKKRACADLTNNNSDWRYISPYIQGKSALFLAHNNTPKKLYSSSTRWKSETTTKIEFDKLGGQKENSTRHYFYEYASTYRAELNALTKDEINKKLLDSYNDIVAKDINPSFKISGLEDVTQPIKIKSEAVYKPFIDPELDLDYTEQDAWIKSELDSIKISNEDYESFISGIEARSNYTFNVSILWSLHILPSDLELTHKFGKLSRKSTQSQNGELVVNTVVNIPQQTITPESIKEFNKMIDLFKRESNIYFYAKLK